MNQMLIARINEELPQLEREAGIRDIQKGIVKAGGVNYLGIIVGGLRVNAQRFNGAKTVRALILVPERYPNLPPLGVYVDRPYEVDGTRHFVRRGYHGAPTLEANGWYWWCHALGGFDGGHVGRWRPSGDPTMGHNLATVLVAARVQLGRG